MTERTPIDFIRLAAALLDRAHSLVPAWLPNGVERTGRWYVGDFDGGKGESANVNLTTGQWIDNAAPDEDKGGDLISLYARIHNLNNGQAARKLMIELGWERPSEDRVQTPVRTPAPAPSAAASTNTLPAPAKRVPKWRAVVPVPPHAPPATFVFGYKDEKKGVWVDLDAVRTWEYRFEGQLYGYVARFERVNSDGVLVKDTTPRTWCENLEDDRGLQRWHWKQWEAPRPLYVPATILSGDLSLPVVVVEGEKCAEAGNKLLGHEFDFVSWPGGCKAWAYASWGWLGGRTVYLWPDCDAQRVRLTKAERDAGVSKDTKELLEAHRQPGMQAMVNIGSLLQADEGCTVLMCRIPEPGDVSDGWDIADAIDEGWDAERVRAFIRSAVAFESPNDEARAKAKSTPSIAGADPEVEATSWRAKLLTSGTGTTKPARENVVLALDGMRLPDGRWLPGIPEAASVIAFNEFTNDVVKLKPTPWGTAAGVWDEVDELELGDWLTREHWLPSMSRQTLEEAVSMVARRHRYHPPREKVEGLRGTWDGEKRLAGWLERCCRKGATLPADDPLAKYLARVGTWVIMAMCQRVLQPGCKFDNMLVLEGGQGMGKSTLAKTLGGEWFADTGLVLGDKDSYQNLQGILVYEWGELDSLAKAEITKVKGFISSPKDRFRASFDRRPKDYPRQVVFIGTTNESHYLSDPTGNRRFWPVRITRFIDLDWLRANLDQMMAEAVEYLDNNQRFHPTQAEQRDLFDPQQLERTIDNALESGIRRYLYDEDQKPGMNGLNGSLLEHVSLSDLLSALGISLDKQTQAMAKQASAALGRMGWERVRASGKGGVARPWVYRRPKEGGTAPDGDDTSTGLTQASSSTERDDDCPF